MTKPFGPRELIARIQAMMRRPRTTDTARSRQIRTFGDLSIDVEGREVTVDGVPVSLTRTEFDVLAALSQDPASSSPVPS